MKMITRITLAAALITIVLGCKSQKMPKNTDEGFTTLFNGKNFDGWHLRIRNEDPELAKKVFTVENGIVHVFRDIPDSSELNTGKNTTHGLFYTNNSYSKYIFKFEYKWGKKKMNNFAQFQYDAGMYYHVYDEKIWPKGIEYQVRYDHTKDINHTGDFWAGVAKINWFSKDGKTFSLPENGGVLQPYKKGEHAALATAKHNALNDKWNQCEVIVMGNKYAIHKLNGEIVNMAVDLSVGEGTIGLQSETAEIFYRNIKIKEFTEEIPMEVFLPKK